MGASSHYLHLTISIFLEIFSKAYFRIRIRDKITMGLNGNNLRSYDLSGCIENFIIVISRKFLLKFFWVYLESGVP